MIGYGTAAHAGNLTVTGITLIATPIVITMLFTPDYVTGVLLVRHTKLAETLQRLTDIERRLTEIERRLSEFGEERVDEIGVLPRVAEPDRTRRRGPRNQPRPRTLTGHPRCQVMSIMSGSK